MVRMTRQAPLFHHEKRERIMNSNNSRLSSQSLAALIADALIEAGLLKKEAYSQAESIIIEEIEVRKALGDYSPLVSTKHQ